MKFNTAFLIGSSAMVVAAIPFDTAMQQASELVSSDSSKVQRRDAYLPANTPLRRRNPTSAIARARLTRREWTNGEENKMKEKIIAEATALSKQEHIELALFPLPVVPAEYCINPVAFHKRFKEMWITQMKQHRTMPGKKRHRPVEEMEITALSENCYEWHEKSDGKAYPSLTEGSTPSTTPSTPAPPSNPTAAAAAAAAAPAPEPAAAGGSSPGPAPSR